jgi:hypothetical protein
MIKTSIGELKLSPIKENGKFVFINTFITINGKVSKGDSIKIFVDAYQQANGKHLISSGNPSAVLVVRGQEHANTEANGHTSVEDYYNHVSELYKNLFYFGKKATQ